jgi:hypothetical protein
MPRITDIQTIPIETARPSMRDLDIFPKATDSELRVRTEFGGFLSLASVFFLVLVLVSEVRSYLQTPMTTTLVLNERTLPATMQVRFDLLLFNNCSFLHVEVTNVKRTMAIESRIRHSFEQVGNACEIRAILTVPTVPASFHVGIGDSYYGEDGNHQHLSYVLHDRNVSHRITHVRFGDVPDLDSPMTGSTVILTKPSPYMITYFVQLIAVRRGGRLGYQTVASLAKTNLEKMRTKGIGGVVFEWDFAPVALEASAVRPPVIELVCHMLAVFGCGFVFVKFADWLVSM